MTSSTVEEQNSLESEVPVRVRVFAKKTAAVIFIFAVSILFIGQAYAQVAGATLTGTVKDASGAAIPNAQVAITDVARE